MKTPHIFLLNLKILFDAVGEAWNTVFIRKRLDSQQRVYGWGWGGSAQLPLRSLMGSFGYPLWVVISHIKQLQKRLTGLGEQGKVWVRADGIEASACGAVQSASYGVHDGQETLPERMMRRRGHRCVAGCLWPGSRALGSSEAASWPCKGCYLDASTAQPERPGGQKVCAA